MPPLEAVTTANPELEPRYVEVIDVTSEANQEPLR